MKSPTRDGRKILSSLTGLGTFPNREPSHKWLGYFQGQRCDAENGNRDGRAPQQSSSRAAKIIFSSDKKPKAMRRLAPSQ
jgi:hypothetical protein